MVKVFQGDCHTVETDFNNWAEVYHPRVVDIKQSVIHVEREHSVTLILTVIYEAKSESGKVEYRMFGHPAQKR